MNSDTDSAIEQLRKRGAGWASSRLGKECLYDVVERSRKGVEEAAEFAQAVGLTEADALRIVMHVYKQKPGQIRQELAGMFLTVLLSATATGYDVYHALQDELDRVETVSQDMIEAKQAMKKAAGISAY